MSNTPSLTPKDIIKILQQKGFVLDRSRGSHQIWLQPVSRKRAIVPMHNKDLPIGTLYSILKRQVLIRMNFNFHSNACYQIHL